MRFFTNIKTRIKRAWAALRGITYNGQPYSIARTGGEKPWGAKAQPPMAVATVYRCVKLLSDSVAALDLDIKTLRGGVYRPQRDRLWYLFNVAPNPETTAFDMRAQAVIDLLLNGNAYILPTYVYKSGVSALWLLRPGEVSHDTTANTYKVTSDEHPGLNGTYAEDEIIHIKGLGSNPKTGLGVIAYARLTLDIASVGDNEAKSRLETGGSLRGIISNNFGSGAGFGEYVDEQLEQIAISMNNQVQNQDQRIYFLPGDSKFSQISMTSADMQFLESRKFTVREICRFFGVHPSFVFDDTSNNYKSAEMANVAFLSNTLNPLLRKIEVELLRKLVTPDEAVTTKIEFDRRGLMAADMEGRMRYISQMLGSGLATVNELRAMEDREPVEGGDVALVSANLRTINDITTNTQPTNGNQGN